MKFTSSPAIAIWLCGFLACASGCGSTGLNMSMFSSETHEKESAENFVEQVIPVWQEAEGAGLKPNSVSKGFGAQIYFISHNKGLPTEVHGSVRIYVFDDLGTPEEQSKPFHQFDFPAEAWKLHLTMSKLGPAYQVFIPYTREGGRKAQCALRIRYTPEKGAPVFSQMVTIDMPGWDPNANKKKDGTEAVTVPNLSRRGKSSRKVTQVSATGELQEQKQVQTLGYESSAKPKKAGSRTSRSSQPAALKSKPKSAKDAFIGDDPDDLPADEPSVEELLSGGLNLDPTAADDEDVEPAGDEQEQEEADSTMRTYTIPLGK